ncbi:MAG TPA: hypothetical protein ENI39_01160 [Anaerolineae bacterium]|nr:hypothetical protein [Anaerolineae bacterium]
MVGMGRNMQIVRAGVPSGCLSIPCRYIHSPVSLLSLADFENTVRLMREALRRLQREDIMG